jgi:hypothetical protein
MSMLTHELGCCGLLLHLRLLLLLQLRLLLLLLPLLRGYLGV